HMVAPADTYLRLFGPEKSPAGRDIVLVNPESRPANECMWEILKRNLPILESERANNFLHFFTPGMKKLPNYIELDTPEINFKAYRNKASLTLSEEEMQHGREWLASMGIGPDDWYVCVANRDPAYLERTESARDWTYSNFRNSSVDGLVDAATEIVRRGGYVFRMGAEVDRPWPGPKNDKIIDYAVHHYSPFLDVFLSATCRFFLANNNGLGALPNAFGTRMCFANMVPYIFQGFQPGGFSIPKLATDITTGEVLHFRELKKRGLFDLNSAIELQFADAYPQRGISLIENTAEDILALCLDMFTYGSLADVPPEIREFQGFYVREYIGIDSPFVGAPIAPSFIRNYRSLME
ncbi:MAG: hypothetical protein CMM61_03050, partial [Rhodospirillaceae bacterium]|nr:hypothetical protein [Rhodospirillaceae bacterium]